MTDTWIWPAIITVIAYVTAFAFAPKPESSAYMGDFGAGLVLMFFVAGATIVSLAAWLAWAVL